MKIKTLYGVVIKFNNGGENMDSFLVKDSALDKAKEIINFIKLNNKKGIKVYLSELEYDEYNNRILSNSLISNQSELLFNN